MSIHLLGLACSPRDNSNSRILLTESFKTLENRYTGDVTTEIVDLREYHIEPCVACAVCGKRKDTGEFVDCVQKDKDDVQMILDKMVAAQGLLVATPVYFGMPTDLFSRFIMRTRLLRHQDFKLANRPVGVMAIAGRRSGGAETTIIQTWLPFLRNGCLPLGNGDKTGQYGAMCWAGKRGHILSDEWGLEQGFQTAERVFQVAKLIQAGIQALNYKNPMTFCYSSGTRA